MLNNIKQYLLERVQEPSTWRGLILLATVCGISISPEQQELITMIGLGVVGFLGAITKGK